MSVKAKLIEILSVPIHPRIGADPAEVVADYLLDNGVTIPVRCKDCKHWAFTCDNMGDCQNPRFAIPDTVDPTMCAHEFCALGERKEV